MNNRTNALSFLSYLNDTQDINRDFVSLHNSICNKLFDTGFLFRDDTETSRYWVKYPGLCVGDKKEFQVLPTWGKDSSSLCDERQLLECRVPMHDTGKSSYLIPPTHIPLDKDEMLDFDELNSFDKQYWNYDDVKEYAGIFVPSSLLDYSPLMTRNLVLLILGIAKRYLVLFNTENRRCEILKSVIGCIEGLIPDPLLDVPKFNKKGLKEKKREAIIQCIGLSVMFCIGQTMALYDQYKNKLLFSIVDFPEIFIDSFNKKGDFWWDIYENGCDELVNSDFYKTIFSQINKSKTKNILLKTDKAEFRNEYFKFEVSGFLNSMKPNHLSILYNLLDTDFENTAFAGFDTFKKTLLSFTSTVDYSYVFDNGKTWKDYNLVFFSDEYRRDIENLSVETVIDVLKKYKFFGDGDYNLQLKKLIELLRKQHCEMPKEEFDKQYNYLENGIYEWFHYYPLNANVRLVKKQDYQEFYSIFRDLIQDKMDVIFDRFLHQTIRNDFTDEELRKYVFHYFAAAEDVAKEKGVKLFDWEKEYDMIKNNKKLVVQIAFSQKVYEDFMKTRNNYELISGDYTVLVCGFIKAVERFLKEIWLHDPKLKYYGIILPWIDGDNKIAKGRRGNDADDLICFTDTEQTDNITLAPLAKAISFAIRKGVFLAKRTYDKDGKKIFPFELKEEFIDGVRNGHFHIHMIETLEDAEKKYSQCSYYFRRCIDDINYTLPC